MELTILLDYQSLHQLIHVQTLMHISGGGGGGALINTRHTYQRHINQKNTSGFTLVL